jgi:hypothetical protein
MPSKKKPRILLPRSIQDDTGIVPEAVIEKVVNEVNVLLNTNNEEDLYGLCASRQSDLYGYLMGYAEAVYANNPRFRKKIRSEAHGGNAGRDYLYSFMRHWLSAEILKSCPTDDVSRIRRILESSGFAMGREIY